jgi:predicted signal transduction protein with EAL and GGDEF domain
MPQWLSIVLPIVIPLFCVIIGVIANNKTKFASTEEEADQKLKLFFLQFLPCIGILFMTWALARDVLSSDTLTHIEILAIALDVSSIMLGVTLILTIDASSTLA